MDTPLLLDLANYLIIKNIVTEDGVDIFRDFQPESPDSVVVLTEYGGSAVNPYDDALNRSVQILVRDKVTSTAKQRCIDIFELLKANINEDRSIDLYNNTWSQLYLRQSPFKIGIDSNNRAMYVFNVGITTTKIN